MDTTSCWTVLKDGVFEAKHHPSCREPYCRADYEADRMNRRRQHEAELAKNG